MSWYLYGVAKRVAELNQHRCLLCGTVGVRIVGGEILSKALVDSGLLGVVTKNRHTQSPGPVEVRLRTPITLSCAIKCGVALLA